MRSSQIRFNVVTLTDLDGIEGIHSNWEQMQKKEPSPALNPDIDRYIACLKTNKGSPCLPREAREKEGLRQGPQAYSSRPHRLFSLFCWYSKVFCVFAAGVIQNFPHWLGLKSHPLLPGCVLPGQRPTSHTSLSFFSCHFSSTIAASIFFQLEGPCALIPHVVLGQD